MGTNLLAIGLWAKEMILGAGAESCYVDYSRSFGRGPFGHYIWTAVNDATLHGMSHDYALSTATCSRSTSRCCSRDL